MNRRARSLTDWPGFMNSALPRMLQPVASEARRSLISGVLPMAARTSSLNCIASVSLRSNQAVGPWLGATNGRVQNLRLVCAWNIARRKVRDDADAEGKIARIRHVEPAQEFASGQVAGKVELQDLGAERMQPPLDAGDCVPHPPRHPPGEVPSATRPVWPTAKARERENFAARRHDRGEFPGSELLV